jgi:hypothetical protein
MKLCHRYTFFCIQVLAGAFALGFDSAIATSLNMLPEAGIKILAAMRNNHPSEALQEQRKLSQAINVITRNGMCLRDRLLALYKVRGTRLARVFQGSTLVLYCTLILLPKPSQNLSCVLPIESGIYDFSDHITCAFPVIQVLWSWRYCLCIRTLLSVIRDLAIAALLWRLDV